MIDGIEQFYQQIAEAVAESIHEPWQTATVEAVFFPESITFVGEYSAENGSHPTGFEVGLKLIRAFRGLRELFRSTGKPVWCRAKFEMSCDGKFKMNWGYDGCDKDGFAPFDEEQEAERMKQIRIRQGLSS